MFRAALVAAVVGLLLVPGVGRPASATPPTVTLRLVESLAATARHIVFLAGDRWLSASGNQTVLWEGTTPRKAIDQMNVNRLLVTTDGKAALGDSTSVDLKTWRSQPALSVLPELLRGPHRPDGSAVTVFVAHTSPDHDVAVLKYDWRPGRMRGRTNGRPASSKPPEAIGQWPVISLKSGAVLKTLTPDKPHNTPWLAWAPRWMAVGGMPNDHSIQVFARPGLEKVAELKLAQGFLNRVIFSPGQRFILAKDNAGNLATWTTTSWKTLATWRFDSQVWALDVDPSERFVAIGLQQGALRLESLEAKPRTLATLTLPGRPSAARFSPDGQRLFVAVERSEGSARGQILVYSVQQSN